MPFWITGQGFENCSSMSKIIYGRKEWRNFFFKKMGLKPSMLLCITARSLIIHLEHTRTLCLWIWEQLCEEMSYLHQVAPGFQG